MKPQPTTTLWRGLAAALIAFCMGACGGNEVPVRSFPIEAPELIERNSLRSEAKVARIHLAIGESLAEIRPGDCRALGDVLGENFQARFEGMAKAQTIADSKFTIRVLRSGGERVMGAADFLGELARSMDGWRSIERRSFELDRFFLDAGGERATGRAELYLAGELESGGRSDFRMVAEVSLEDTLGGWCLTQLDLLEAIAIEGNVTPFMDVTASTGFSHFTSEDNRSMLQSFIDEHRVLALGGLSAVDWNGDGFMDVVVSLEDSLSTVLMNDGLGGFIPHETPIENPMDCGVSLLRLDLDGDGVDELVSSKELAFLGETGHFGLYVQNGGDWEFRPDAFEFANPLGLRGVKAQTVVPLDVNGDGLMDLFFGVYGTFGSRGENYNLVEAHDGGTNHLFINQGGLQFREETVERGMAGVHYTYVALPYDFDGDGDVDLFEGNDFGRNILWINDGNGYFTADEESVFARDSAYTMGITLADHDDDGRPSLYVVNMSSEAGARIGRTVDGLSDSMRQRVLTIASGNWMYSQEEDGTWREHAGPSGCAEGEWGWGAMFCDLDGDGDDEIFATNGFTSHSDPKLGDWDPYFWRQVAADGTFLERGISTQDVNADLPFKGSYAGQQRDRLFYRADGDDQRFYDTAWHFGLDNIEDGRCVVPFDMDGDGDLDLALFTLQGLRLYQNQSPPKPFAFIRLRATKTHPAALGARVKVRVGDRFQYDTVQLVEGFQSQQPLQLHFAWETAQAMDEVTVTWPSGEQQVFLNLPLGQNVLLVEGDPVAHIHEVARWPDDCRNPGQLGAASSPRPGPRKPGVDNLAAKARVERYERDALVAWPARDALAERFPDVVFATVDRDGPFGSTFVYSAQGELCRGFFRTPSAEDLGRLLTELEDEPWFPGLAIMTGRRLLGQNKPKAAARLFREAMVGDSRSPTAAEGLARAERLLGNIEQSEQAYLRAVQIDPDYALGHFNLAVLRMRTGRAELSLDSFEEALRIRGEDVGTLLAMGEAALVGGLRERAVEILARAGRAAPESAEPHILRGKVLGQMERYLESEKAFARAMELEPMNLAAQRGIANARELAKESK